MSDWLAAYNIFDAVANVFGITKRQLKEQRPISTKYLTEFLTKSDERLGRAWAALLTGQISQKTKF